MHPLTGTIDPLRRPAPIFIFSLVFAAALLLAIPAPVLAQQPTAGVPRVVIERFEVQGNTLLAAPEIEQALAPFRGADKAFTDLQQAADALEESYRARGYSAVQVLLP